MTVTCPVCGGATLAWRLAARDVVDRFPECGTVARDLAGATLGARSPAYGGDPGMDRFRLAVTYRRLRRLVAPRGARVFEVGFGTGALLRRFLDDGAQVAGTHPGLLELAVDPEVAARGDLHDVGLAEVPSAGHDLVDGVHVVEHVRDVAGFAVFCHDLLRPGGRLVLVAPAGDCTSARRYRARWWMWEDPTHVRFLTAGSARRLLEGAGFVDVRVRRLGLDSLAADAASWARAARWPRLAAAGVLFLPGVWLLVLVSAPAVVLVWTVVPSTRPAMEVTAQRADHEP